MTNNQFYELYSRLAALQTSNADCHPIIEELTRLCLETIRNSSLQECLAVAALCFREIGQSEQLFTVALACWLTEDKCIDLAKVLTHEASVSHLQANSPVAYDLSSTEESRARLAACRLCALHVSPAISLGWTLSLATSFPASATTLNTAQALLQHHMKDYPSTTLRLLSSPNSSFSSLLLAQTVLKRLEQQRSHLNALPKLRELVMPPEMRLIYASLKRSENRDIQRQSEEKSIFDQFITRQHFKYASKTAIEVLTGDDVRETTLEMMPFQIATELPSTWLTDPVSGDLAMNRQWEGVLE
ncbi:hypothetical protein [Dickeya dadantii]|uniref:hypothetical protein n=1 Tax=Dickeya dadantii TaxID=204038 RepID=UPI0003A22FE1|nr:hypothetical protein [Dickeya dadantii]